MTSKEMNCLLIQEFPDLKKTFDDEVSWQDGDKTGSHVVYGDIFTPYIVTNMEQNNSEMLLRIFEFIEKVLNSKDLYASEVIAFSVLESIEYYLLKRPDIEDMMGGLAKKDLEEIRHK